MTDHHIKDTLDRQNEFHALNRSTKILKLFRRRTQSSIGVLSHVSHVFGSADEL